MMKKKTKKTLLIVVYTIGVICNLSVGFNGDGSYDLRFVPLFFVLMGTFATIFLLRKINKEEPL